MLTDLATLPGVIRLTKRRAHVIRGEGERNEYAWAIYRVAGLEPYRARLAELKGVQQRVFGELALKRVYTALIEPRVVVGVTHVRPGVSEAHKSHVREKPTMLGIIDTALKTTKKNLREFQIYGGEHDDGVRRLEAEPEALGGVRATVIENAETLYCAQRAAILLFLHLPKWFQTRLGQMPQPRADLRR